MYGDLLANVPPDIDPEVALETVRKNVAVGKPDGPAQGSAEASVPYLTSDHMLLRFLEARQWNTERATAMLKDHFTWLADVKMAALLADPFPEEAYIKKFYPQAFHGTDKRGRPIYIERPGLIDMPRLMQVMTPERLLEYFYAGTEKQIRQRFPACSLAIGKVVDKSLNIIDLSGLGFRVVSHTIARRVLRDIVVMLQNHYPECTGQVLIINAPKVFSIAWSFVKPLLDDKTVAKISIHGSETHTQALLDLVDAGQLPRLFGGTCVCDGIDAESCMRSNMGPWSDPEIVAIIQSEPLEQIMTAEGSQILRKRRYEKQRASVVNDILNSPVASTLSECSDDLDARNFGYVVQSPRPVDVTDTVLGTDSNQLLHVQPKSSGPCGVDSMLEPGMSVADALATVPIGKVPQTRAFFNRPPESIATAPPSHGQANRARIGEQGQEDMVRQSDMEKQMIEINIDDQSFVPSPDMMEQLREADLEVVLLLEECEEHDKACQSCICNWVDESNRLAQSIGRNVIERAQSYYDVLSVLEQLRAEQSKKNQEMEQITFELEKASANLATAEAAFENFLAGRPGLTEEEWARLAPLSNEGKMHEAAVGDAKLLRSFRLSSLADCVAEVQEKRVAVAAEISVKTNEVEDAKVRFQAIQEEHRKCTGNCSIQRAAAFYNQRQVHEAIVQAQQCMLESVVARYHKARHHAARLRASILECPCTDTHDLTAAPVSPLIATETDLHSFEIAGGEPQDDEYLSCESDSSN